MRYALLRGEWESLATIQRYLPQNYIAYQMGNDVWIEGEDWHGWTLDGYVIPRLASGNFYAKEMFDV